MSASCAATSNNDAVGPAKGLLPIVKQGFSSYTAAQQAGLPTPLPLQQQLMPLVMGFAGGNWAFMDAVLPHVGPGLVDYVASIGNGDIPAGAKIIGADVNRMGSSMLTKAPALGPMLQGLCNPGTADEVVTATAANVGLLIEKLLVLAVEVTSGATSGLFSERAKSIVVSFSGGWLEQIGSYLVAGRAGLMGFLQALSGAFTPMVVALFPPEISMYTMFATPLVMNMLMQFHQQFLQARAAEEADMYA